MDSLNSFGLWYLDFFSPLRVCFIVCFSIFVYYPIGVLVFGGYYDKSFGEIYSYLMSLDL